MTSAPLLHVYPGQEAPAERLASQLGFEARTIDIHTFPDGESRVRIVRVSGTALIYASLDHPNEKLVHVLMTAHALRENGAVRVVLVCPYLCYMRQDIAFHEGEAVSQRLIGNLLGQAFDRIVTVDPHLHRIASLDQIMPDSENTCLSATELLVKTITADPMLQDALLVGPDAESEQWVGAAAQSAGHEYLVATKVRRGDRTVEVSLEGAERARGRPVVIVDDLISSGMTIRRCAELLKKAGASRVEAMGVHTLCSKGDYDAILASGVDRVRSCDSILHQTNSIELAPLLAAALEGEV